MLGSPAGEGHSPGDAPRPSHEALSRYLRSGKRKRGGGTWPQDKLSDLHHPKWRGMRCVLCVCGGWVSYSLARQQSERCPRMVLWCTHYKMSKQLIEQTKKGPFLSIPSWLPATRTTNEHDVPEGLDSFGSSPTEMPASSSACASLPIAHTCQARPSVRVRVRSSRSTERVRHAHGDGDAHGDAHAHGDGPGLAHHTGARCARPHRARALRIQYGTWVQALGLDTPQKRLRSRHAQRLAAVL